MTRHQSKGHLKNVQSLAIGFKITDMACIFFVLGLATWSYTPTTWNSTYTLLGLGAALTFAIVSEITTLYHTWRGSPFRAEFNHLIITWLGTVVILLLIAYATKTTAEFSRLALGLWASTTPIAMGSWRIIVRSILGRLRAKGYNTRAIAIIGANETGANVVRTVNESPWLGFKMLGFFDDRAPDPERTAPGCELQGTFDDLLQLEQRGEVDAIYITLPLTAQPRIMEFTDRLADATTSVYLVPDFFIYSLFHGQGNHWTQLGDLPTISLFDTPFWGVDGWIKRFQDIILAAIILALIGVPMMLIAIAIKATSSGPVLFKQRRYGIDGKEIMVWKFRSMHVQDDGATVIQAVQNDARLTRIGGRLRRTSLDELPQFINVLMGSMSIVGPRPHAVAHNEEYRPKIKGYMLRHAVKPGITGWAQINGWRGETDTLSKMENRIQHDLWYIRNWSTWLDLKIITLTIVRGFVGPTAY
ncbi:hypothetical protein MNBD_GAMMA26-967 [hydrothermal vent metagenome]|uniref:Bacterial sugar transferase domain-containing protein n=1 Tax=hydrothermal vent metagenome TaxID=652676 RepID=A0A3B1B2H4_9ZZZZ